LNLIFKKGGEICPFFVFLHFSYLLIMVTAMKNIQQTINSALTSTAAFRRVCDELCNANPEQPRMKTIAAVGAYDGRIGGAGVDSQRLTGVVSYLLQSGVMIDPDFEVDVVNFREKRDFLSEDKQADLVFVSLILAQHIFRATYNYHERLHEIAKERSDYRYVFGTAISPENSALAWNKRMVAAGAKIVATYGGPHEIGTHNLCGVDNERAFRTLIATPEHSMWQHVDKTDGDKDIGGFTLNTKVGLSFLYNDAANDLPMPWLGFAAAPGYLKEAKGGLSRETTLGRRAQELAHGY
jgi:hypothetical protein